MHVRFQYQFTCSTNLEGEDAKWPFWIKTPDKYTDKLRRLKFLFLVRIRKSLVTRNLVMVSCIKDANVHTGVMQCLDLRRRVRNCLVKHSKRRTLLSSNLLSLCSCRMDKEHTVLGIEHDEGTTF